MVCMERRGGGRGVHVHVRVQWCSGAERWVYPLYQASFPHTLPFPSFVSGSSFFYSSQQQQQQQPQCRHREGEEEEEMLELWPWNPGTTCASTEWTDAASWCTTFAQGMMACAAKNVPSPSPPPAPSPSPSPSPSP